MKKQRGSKKIKMPGFIKEFKDAAIRNAIALVSAIVILAAFVYVSNYFLCSSSYFRLRAIETKSAFIDQSIVADANNDLLRLYKGKNVFVINLKAIARSLEAVYPDATDIRVRIGLPDRLIVNLKYRKPVALIFNKQYYPIDEDGYVLPSVDARSLSGLIAITGVDIKNIDRRSHWSVSRNLKTAIELLKAIKRSKFLSDYNIKSIDAKDAGNLLFYLSSGVEVRIGSENFDERIMYLENTLKNPRLVLDAVKYIDVRFKDIVIGPK